MFDKLEEINRRPEPFEFYTAEELWNDEYTSMRMLEYHLDENSDISSRNKLFIEDSVDWIVKHFGIDNGFSICDFGCGPGLYKTRFAEKGAKVTGIDFSKRSVEYAKSVAKEKCLEIEYLNEDYLSFETYKRYDLITMIMCDYCALNPEQRDKLLKIFFKHLKPKGLVLLDVYTLELFNNRKEQSIYNENLLNGFWSSEKYYGFVNTFKYDKEKVVLDKYTIVEKSRTRVIYNWLQYFSQESLKIELERNKFEIQQIYSDVAGSKYVTNSSEMAIVARKAI